MDPRPSELPPVAMAPSHAWTRDGGSSRGVAAPSRGRGATRGRGKRVWSRKEAEERECDPQRPPSDLDPDAPAFVPKRARISTQESLARELQKKQEEAERLKMELEAKRRAVEEEKERRIKMNAARAEAKKAMLEEEKRKRAQKLAAGFASAVKSAEEFHATRKAQEQAMEEEERLDREARMHEEESVSRVLVAGTDYEVLDVKVGATQEEIRAAYRKLARELHPDKSTARRAKDAFQRLTKAYQSLSSAVR